MITAAEREFALQLLDETRDRVLGMLGGLSSEQLLYRQEPGRWSVAENMEHVIVVERRLLLAIEKLLDDPPDLATQSVMNDQEVLRRVGTVVERLQAPEIVLPTSSVPAEDLSREFEAIRQTTRAFASSTNGDLRHHFRRHPFFGDFDAYQWLLLIGAHTTRHTNQSKAVIASANFPRKSQPATS